MITESLSAYKTNLILGIGARRLLATQVLTSEGYVNQHHPTTKVHVSQKMVLHAHRTAVIAGRCEPLSDVLKRNPYTVKKYADAWDKLVIQLIQIGKGF